jgi:hypothetical protein
VASLALAKYWRAVLLASQLAFGVGSAAQAHSLPAAVLVFSQAEQKLELSITLAVHDLEIAAPQFASFSDAPVPYDLPADSIILLAEYLGNHLLVQHEGTDLQLTVSNASLSVGSHEDVGTYKTLVIGLTSTVDSNADIFPLTIRYDAVMHEVRNHRAQVYWVEPNQEHVRLTEIGFQTTDGMQTGVTLALQ